jgi:hypothetical protein
LLEEEVTKKDLKNKPKKEKLGKSVFASYEEFAHLLDEDSENEKQQKHIDAKLSGQKRMFHQRTPSF